MKRQQEILLQLRLINGLLHEMRARQDDIEVLLRDLLAQSDRLAQARADVDAVLGMHLPSRDDGRPLDYTPVVRWSGLPPYLATEAATDAPWPEEKAHGC